MDVAAPLRISPPPLPRPPPKPFAWCSNSTSCSVLPAKAISLQPCTSCRVRKGQGAALSPSPAHLWKRERGTLFSLGFLLGLSCPELEPQLFLMINQEISTEYQTGHPFQLLVTYCGKNRRTAANSHPFRVKELFGGNRGAHRI